MKKWALTLTDEDNVVLDKWTTDDVLNRSIFIELCQNMEVSLTTTNRIRDHLEEIVESELTS